jgi:hypothetical protein
MKILYIIDKKTDNWTVLVFLGFFSNIFYKIMTGNFIIYNYAILFMI